jgi:hypothetical protein
MIDGFQAKALIRADCSDLDEQYHQLSIHQMM